MASTKVVFYKWKKLKNGNCPLMLQVVKDRNSKYISIGHSCHPDHWDTKNNTLRKKHPNYKRLIIHIKDVEKKANNLILDYENDNIDFSLDEFKDKFNDKRKKVTVYGYFQEWIDKYHKLEKIGNARIYKDTLKALQRFRDNKDMNFSEVNLKLLNDFVGFYELRGVKPNSVGVYMRTFRSLYNKAIDDDIVKKELYPFGKLNWNKLKGETDKRHILKVDIKKIIELSLEEETSLWHSRNYFLFSFYNMGMNFMDIALLKRSEIQNGRVKYTRAKTGKKYDIGLLPPAIDILDYYKIYNPDTDYVFPLLNPKIHKTPQSINNRIQRCRKITNSDLKIIAEQAGIESNLTTYVARHSWATILKRSGISTSIISEGLGHTREKTTQAYLDSFEKETMDNANMNIL